MRLEAMTNEELGDELHRELALIADGAVPYTAGFELLQEIARRLKAEPKKKPKRPYKLVSYSCGDWGWGGVVKNLSGDWLAMTRGHESEAEAKFIAQRIANDMFEVSPEGWAEDE